MLTHEENELVCRTGPGTPMGILMRRYWIPVLFSEQLPGPDCAPVRVKLLGEVLRALVHVRDNVVLDEMNKRRLNTSIEAIERVRALCGPVVLRGQGTGQTSMSSSSPAWCPRFSLMTLNFTSRSSKGNKASNFTFTSL